MEDAPIQQGPPQEKLRKKIRKAQILEIIREFLEIPDDIPRGGAGLKKYLKQIGAKRLKMAIDHVLPFYDQYFKGEFTHQKLYRWVVNNGKIHKRSLIQSEEAKELVLEEIRKKFDQGVTQKALRAEIAPIIGQQNQHFTKSEVSKSSIIRLMKQDRQYDVLQGSKKIKRETNIVQDISIEHHPFEAVDHMWKIPLENCFDVESYSIGTDACRSIELLSLLPESMDAIDNLYQELSA